MKCGGDIEAPITPGRDNVGCLAAGREPLLPTRLLASRRGAGHVCANRLVKTRTGEPGWTED